MVGEKKLKNNDHDMFDMLVSGPGQRGKADVRTQLMQYHKWTDDHLIPDNLIEFRAMVLPLQ